MIFASDNWAGAAPEIAASLSDYAASAGSAYGNSDLDSEVREKLQEIFEHELAIYYVGTGTAANSLALAAYSRPGGFIACHSHAHIAEDECGAVEFLSSGGRLLPIHGDSGKMDIPELEKELQRVEEVFVHHGQPMAVSMTQATEAGTVYSLDEIEHIGAAAKSVNVPLHMDGARFANALVALDCSPAEMTWKRGVDVLSFGATKNGCWCAEALIFFDPKMHEQVQYLHKRSAQLFSKSRFVSAQMTAYLKDNLWLSMAQHSNTMADKIRAGISASKNATHGWETEANEIFVILEKAKASELRAVGAQFYEWPVPPEMERKIGPEQDLFRLVTSFATKSDDVDQFLKLLG